MTKKEFFELVQKFENGQCTAQEENVLFQYCNDVQIKDFVLSDKDRTRIRILKRILNNINDPKVKKMKPKRRNFWYAAAIVIGLISCGYVFLIRPLNLNTEPANMITLEHEDGSVEILNEDGSKSIFDEGGNVVRQQQGNQLTYDSSEISKELVYNTLTIPYGKRFILNLSDGTTVHLNAGTSIKYPEQFIKGKKREVFINGEAYLDVAKDSLHPFFVNMKGVHVKVLGTQFNVSAYPEDETTDVVLVEGAVNLFDTEKGDQNATVLKPGFKASFDKEDQQITTTEVVTGIYTAWMKGELVFRNMTFKNIMKKLERHYNVIIVNDNTTLSDKLFNASFGNEPLELVLEDFKRNYAIDYRIKGNIISIK